MNTEWQSKHDMQARQSWQVRQAIQAVQARQAVQSTDSSSTHPAMSNWEYRIFLTNNATNIMSQNRHHDELANVQHSYHDQNGQNGQNEQNGHSVPYNYRGLNDLTPVRNNTFSSDLKRSYISRMQHQIAMSAPDIYFDNR